MYGILNLLLPFARKGYNKWWRRKHRPTGCFVPSEMEDDEDECNTENVASWWVSGSTACSLRRSRPGSVALLHERFPHVDQLFNFILVSRQCGYGIRFMKQGLTGSPTVWQRLLLVVQIRRLTFRAGLQKQNQNSQHHSRQVDSQKLALMKAGSPKYRKHKNTKHKQQKAGSKTRSTPTAKEFNSKFKAWVCEGKGRENRRREEKSKPLDELPWNLI